MFKRTLGTLALCALAAACQWPPVVPCTGVGCGPTPNHDTGHDSVHVTTPVEHLVTEETIQVPEASDLVDTRLDVKANDRIVFAASGQIWAGVYLTGKNGPEGWNKTENSTAFPLPGNRPFSLIGRVGGGDYFYIGTGTEMSHLPTGRLFLRVNDDVPRNGEGAFSVIVKQYRTE